jgi:hypothetical protein
MNELKLSIARELAQKAFGGAGHGSRGEAEGVEAPGAKEAAAAKLRAQRMAHSARAIANPYSELLYSASIERQLVTTTKVEQIIPALTSLGQDDRCSMHTLALRTVKSIEVGRLPLSSLRCSCECCCRRCAVNE